MLEIGHTSSSTLYLWLSFFTGMKWFYADGLVWVGEMRGREMQIITFHLADRDLELVDRLVERGLYWDRSEFVRSALRRLLARELAGVRG